VTSPSAPLRLLVACPDCHRQYVAGALLPGQRLRCLCGRLLEVPRPSAGEAAVVHCASCGAPRPAGAGTCSFCGAPFAADEATRNTICPACCARIPDAARFCPACGVPIDPAAEAPGTDTALLCPACGAGHPLASRAFPGLAANLLECPACGGLWLARAVFETLERRAATEATGAGPHPVARPVRPAGTFSYRPCPECGKPMNRINYGHRSGVVLDVCARHGLWFDAGELEQVLGWIREGRLEASRQLDREEQAEADRQRRARKRAAVPGELAELSPELSTWRDLVLFVGLFFNPL
jgi:Zn-finger nucleic acid-binding protein